MSNYLLLKHFIKNVEAIAPKVAPIVRIPISNPEIADYWVICPNVEIMVDLDKVDRYARQ